MDAVPLAATVETDRDGRMTVRPAGALAALPHLTGHLRAAATTPAIGEVRFVWLEPESAGARRGASTVAIGPSRADGRRTVHIDGAGPDALAGLNRRELQVLTLVAAGLSNPEIAERLVVGRRTVATMWSTCWPSWRCPAGRRRQHSPRSSGCSPSPSPTGT